MQTLIFTDALHPVTPATLMALREGFEGDLRLIGVGEGRADWVLGCDAYVQVPPSNSVAFTDSLLVLAKAESADLIIPWADEDAVAVSRSVMAFRAIGTKLLCPPARLTELCSDKEGLLTELGRTGFPVAPHVVRRDAAGVERAALDMGYPARTLLAKPNRGSGSHGIFVLAHPTAPPALDGALPTLPLEAFMALMEANNAAGLEPEYLLTTLVEGTDCSIDLLAYEGELRACVLRSRTAVAGGVSIAGQVAANVPVARELGQQLVDRLDWDSVANVQCILDPELETVRTVYEINARISGAIGVSSASGVDVLQLAVRAALGLPVEVTIAATGLRDYSRHWEQALWEGPRH
jgi:hypothetical protein